ncbi:MAG: carboxypeptidase regulatory-like domain-containing protein, partial [Deltaproteobacteria bacterium]|nr:carboxypeptidase regulatory-like domain-containing protein [Deltaproteobacteria bacterium]
SWRALAIAELGASHDVVRHIDMVDAGWAWSNGDVAGGHQRLEALRRTTPNKDARSISGIVVDAKGAPVPGAVVAAGAQFNGDSLAIVLPYMDSLGSLRTTTTDSDGKFTIRDAVPRGIVVAQSAALRSDAVEIADTVKLVVQPTSRLSGRVDLRGIPASRVVFAVSRHGADSKTAYAVVAPVTRDGTFTLDGAPRGQVDLAVMIDGVDGGSNMVVKRADITEPEVSKLELAVPAAQRTIRVLVRSTVGTPSQNAQVMIIPSTRPAKSTLKDLQTQSGDLGGFNVILARPLDRSETGLGKPGDLVASVSVPEGLQTACAIGLPATLDQTLQTNAAAHGDKIEVRCVPIGDGVSEVVVEVPPWPRFD